MIQTNRLHISYSKLSDLNDIYEYVSNKEVMKYEREDYPTLESYRKVLTYLVDHNLLYSIRIKDNNKVIGHIYLGKTDPNINNEYNLGYILNPTYHNKGYCSEASKAVIDYGFKVLNANRIIAACNPTNIPSWKVMENIGLKKEGLFKKRFFIRNDEQGKPVFTDEVMYGLQVDEWVIDENTIIEL